MGAPTMVVVVAKTSLQPRSWLDSVALRLVEARGLGGEADGADALDLHAGGIPKFDGASDIGVKLSEELLLTGHLMGGTGVEAPPASLIAAGAVVEEGVCSRLIKVEESRCGRCRWR
jgi:hypothetical protein